MKNLSIKLYTDQSSQLHVHLHSVSKFFPEVRTRQMSLKEPCGRSPRSDEAVYESHMQLCLSPTRMEMQSNTSKVNMKKRILVIIHIFVFSFDSLHYFRVQQGILRNQALLIQLEQICFFPTKKNMNCRVFFISCIDTIAMSNPVRAKLARDYRWLKASCLPGAEHSQGLTVHVGPPVSSTDHFS